MQEVKLKANSQNFSEFLLGYGQLLSLFSVDIQRWLIEFLGYIELIQFVGFFPVQNASVETQYCFCEWLS